ncbi:coiled-coil and C2 domain-containing protein 1-like isoform X2 [Gordionus sp. m RMFG-2023]|uniref:coiled-coil and C2 domain-containing protein 1-like isoform X2 n=1 Tax=Gordionus sp. m RMFG-2023 TaxID=3053472 RepID=UPI0031FD8754
MWKTQSKDIRKSDRKHIPTIFDTNDEDISDKDLEAELEALINPTINMNRKQNISIVDSKHIINEIMNFNYEQYQVEESKLSDNSDIEKDLELLNELDEIMGSKITKDHIVADGVQINEPCSSPLKRLHQSELMKIHDELFDSDKDLNSKADNNINITEIMQIVEDRIKNYYEVLQTANYNKDLSKSRRIKRGLCTLDKMKNDILRVQASPTISLSFTISTIPPLISKCKSAKIIESENDFNFKDQYSVIKEETIQNANIPNFINTHQNQTKQNYEKNDLIHNLPLFQLENNNLLKDSNDNENIGNRCLKPMDGNTCKQNESSSLSNLPSNKANEKSLEIEKFISLLTYRQSEFKEQAIIAKGNQDLITAKIFLEIYKNYQILIAKFLQLIPPNVETKNITDLIKESKKIPTLTEYISSPQSYKSLGDSKNASPDANNLNNSTTYHPTIDYNEHQISEIKMLNETSQKMVAPLMDKKLMTEIPDKTNKLKSELKERLKIYEDSLNSCKQTDDNPGKLRRMTRIIKQYSDAINAVQNKNWNYAFQELPNPPNFAEISFTEYINGDKIDQKDSVSNQNKQSNNQIILSTYSATSPSLQPQNYPLHITQKLQSLSTRQASFKQAAIISKKQGNITQAKEYLRLMKGFDPLIQACKSGLPIDLSGLPKTPQILSTGKLSIPSSPLTLQSSNTFANINTDGRSIKIDENKKDLRSLEKILKEQIALCERNSKYYMHCGDVSSAKNFDAMARTSKKDFEKLSKLKDIGNEGVKYRFDEKILPLVKSNTELGDNDLELTIIKGFHYDATANKEIDTYVKYEFPFPNTSPQRDKTDVIYGTNNPEYNQTFKLNIDRKSRALARAFKRQSLKLEVYIKGGLMRFINGDRLLGIVNVKLFPFENETCTIHECASLMNNRKEAGGKLEIMLKIRDPLHRKDIEETKLYT